MTEEIYLLAISSLITLITSYSLIFVNPKSKIIYWVSHYTDFVITPQPDPQKVPQQDIPVTTSSIIVQNIGSRPSEYIEIVHQFRPFMFKIFPPIDYTESYLPSTQHVIKINRLASKESFALHCLWSQYSPQLIYVRSEGGLAQSKNIISQPVRSKLYNYTASILLLIGVFSASYWIGRVIVFVLNNL